MAIEVPVRKEITTFESRPAFGLTVRQMIFLFAALVVGAGSYALFVFVLRLSHKAASSLTMLLVVPIFAFGFISIKGYPLEKYLKIVWEHRFTQQKTFYKTENHISMYMTEEERRNDFSRKFLSWSGRKVRPEEEITLTYIPTKKTKKAERKAWNLAKKECGAAAREYRKRQGARQKADARRKGE